MCSWVNTFPRDRRSKPAQQGTLLHRNANRDVEGGPRFDPVDAVTDDHPHHVEARIVEIDEHLDRSLIGKEPHDEPDDRHREDAEEETSAQG